MTYVVVFMSNPSRIEIHTLEEFNDRSNENYRLKQPIVYTEIYCNSLETCFEFCKKHKLELTFKE